MPSLFRSQQQPAVPSKQLRSPLSVGIAEPHQYQQIAMVHEGLSCRASVRTLTKLGTDG